MAEQVIKTPPSHSDVLNRVRTGFMPDVEPATPADKPAEEKVPASAAPAGQPPVEVPATETPASAAPAETPEMDDAAFLELYARKTGKKIKSLDDLKEPAKQPTPEELQLQKENEATEALEWALGSGKIKKDVYEKSVIDKAKSKREIALALFTADVQADDKDITNEEAEELFKDAYFEGEEEGSIKYKKGQKEMNSLADTYLSQYKSIEGITEEFREVKNTAQRQKDYNKQISTIAKEIPTKLIFKIPYEGIDGSKTDLEYEVDVDDKIPAQLIKEFTRPGMENAFGENAKPETIAAELNYHVRARMMDKAIGVLVEKHGEKVLEDAMVKLKNSRNPQQTLGAGTTPQKSTTPPSHGDVTKRVK